jgi:hypothetical protein
VFSAYTCLIRNASTTSNANAVANSAVALGSVRNIRDLGSNSASVSARLRLMVALSCVGLTGGDHDPSGNNNSAVCIYMS